MLNNKMGGIGDNAINPFIATIVVLFLTFMSLRFVLNNDFVNFDDETYLLQNPQVRSLAFGNIENIFRTTVLKEYSPLVILSFAIEYHFVKLNPFVYHLDNLILHGAVICLAMWFCMQLGLNFAEAGLAALLFGIHPMHVESVAWVTERKDVLYAFFYMFSLNCYLNYLTNEKKTIYLLAVINGVLSMLSKPMAISLPLIFFLCDWYFGRNFKPKAIIDKIIIFICFIPILWQTYSLHRYATSAGIYEKVLYTLWTLTFYIKKFFLPYPIDIFYSIPTVNPLDISYWGSAIGLGIWIFLVYHFRHNRIFLFANIFYVFSIFFLLRADHTHESSFGSELQYFVANRFMYLPSLGYCALAGHCLGCLLRKYRRKGIMFFTLIASTIALLFAWLSFESSLQCHNWKDGIQLWNVIISRSPNNAVAYNNRGTLQKGAILALKDFNRCIEIDPNFPEAYFNRANIYFRRGEYDLAIRDYTKCITFDRNDAQAFHFRSLVYYRQENFQRALEDAQEAKSLGLKVDEEYFSMLLAKINVRKQSP